MKINKMRHTTNVRALTGVVFVVAICALYLAIAYQNSLWPFVSKEAFNTEPPSASQVDAGKQQKSQSADIGNSTKQNSGSDPAPQPSQPTDGSTPTVGFNIVSASVNSSSNILHIRTMLQTVTSSGTCKLTMTGPEGKVFTATTDIQAGPSSSSCQGFDIPVSSLSPGAWDISIQYESDTATGLATKEITL